MKDKRGLRSTMAILALTTILSGCGVQDSEKKSESQVSQTANAPRPVLVTKVIAQNLQREAKLPSDLIAYRDVGIYPKIPGFVEWIGVDRGSVVKKGQLLIRMTAPELPAQSRQGIDAATAARDESIQAKDELEVARQQCAAAEARAKSSADTYQRLKGASEYPGIIPGNDLEVAQKTAEADAATARSLEGKCKSLESQQKAANNRHRAALESAVSSKALEAYLRLTAPFDGVITQRTVHEGSFVNPPANASSPPLLRLKQQTTLRLVVPVPESDVGGIAPGTSVRFTVSAYPGESFSGIVRRIAESVDIDTRTMAVELDVSNSDRRLTPGMFAEVLWPMRRNRPTLFVPASAVVKTTEKTFVIRVKNDIAEWIDVKPGISADDSIEVFGNLAEGDQIVLRGTDELRPGMQVSSKELPSNKAER